MDRGHSVVSHGVMDHTGHTVPALGLVCGRETFYDFIRSDIMSKTNFERVEQFMRTFEQEVRTSPELPEVSVQGLRLKLIKEELEELEDALFDNDIVEVADALTDLLYVVYGAGHAFGIDLDACFAEVHRSNMSKLDAKGQVVRRDDGKVLKSDQFTPPDLKQILFPK